ncbi:hypothetical protein Sjap_004867 [Stephania japonica]|uniref:HMA domain-containing protein n=1 Tax=Stephania japonica TaxID=461633 RepID=A0AAP0K4B0_9MAGN
MAVEVRVSNLDCQGCATNIKKALFKLKGVEEIEVDMEMQKISVRGYRVEEEKVIKAIKRLGKAAEPWPFLGSRHSHFASFYKYPAHIAKQYYYCHENGPGASGSGSAHAFFHTPAAYAVASDESMASFFSDENPHACTVM